MADILPICERIAETSLFSGLGEEEKKGLFPFLASYGRLDGYRKKAIVVPGDFCIVDEGIIQKIAMGPGESDKYYMHDFFVKGEFFGNECFYGDEGQMNCLCQAGLDSRVFQLDRVGELVKKSPQIAENIVNNLSEKYRRYARKMLLIRKGYLDERLVELLWELGERAGERGRNGEVKLPLNLTDLILSRMVGSTREYVTSLTLKFREQGLMTKKKYDPGGYITLTPSFFTYAAEALDGYIKLRASHGK